MIIWSLIIGLLVGAVAKFITPGKDPGGCIITTLLGLAGGAVAGFLGQSLGWYQPHEVPGFIAAVLGAVLLLLIYRLIRGKL